MNQGNKTLFDGSLSIDGSQTGIGNKDNGVFSSSFSGLSLQTKVVAQTSVEGIVKGQSTYGNNALPNGFSTSDKEISYWIKQDRNRANQRQFSLPITRSGFFFKSKSHVDGLIEWNDNKIDLSNVENGTFTIEWGEVIGKKGLLSLELNKGCVVTSVDTDDFEGWLPNIGSCSPVILSNSLPNFGFDFEYDLGKVDTDSIFSLQTTTKSAVAPEPLTIIGTFASLGFGVLFKRKYKRNQK